MEDMNELQMTCFEIISYVGTAKSMYINAVQKAKEGDFDAAEELIKQGDEAYNGGHDVHMGLLKKEANGERNGEAPLILLHAEDQMAGTETMRVMATELIEIHKQLQALQAGGGEDDGVVLAVIQLTQPGTDVTAQRADRQVRTGGGQLALTA